MPIIDLMNRLWYARENKENSVDAIHQILAFGSLEEIQTLKKSVGEEVVRDFFLHYPKKAYTAQSFHFIKNFLLHIPSFVDEKKYVTSSFRHTR